MRCDSLIGSLLHIFDRTIVYIYIKLTKHDTIPVVITRANNFFRTETSFKEQVLITGRTLLYGVYL